MNSSVRMDFQVMVQKSGAAFIETMDCLPVSKLPEGPEWT